MKRGFGTIVPLRLMPLFTWQEAEVLVCGSPEIDLDDLKQHTAYQGYKGSDDPTIKHFWTVMEEWGHLNLFNLLGEDNVYRDQVIGQEKCYYQILVM
jgi:hypothetical protein